MTSRTLVEDDRSDILGKSGCRLVSGVCAVKTRCQTHNNQSCAENSKKPFHSNSPFCLLLRSPRIASTISCLKLEPSLFGGGFRTDAKILLVACVIKITDHHFFPGLGSPAYDFRWIWIEFISLWLVVCARG